MNPLLAAAIILLATAAYSALHSLLASLPAKNAARRLFGPSADRFYRLGFNIFGLVTFLPLLAFVAWQPGPRLYSAPAPFSWLMLAGQVGALALIGLGVLQTDAWHFVGVRQLVETAGSPPTLMADGLYRYVRHPLYTAGFLFLWLTPLMTSTLFSFYLGLSLYLYVGSFFEERRLLLEFGPAYRAYQRQTPRLIPRLRRKSPPSPGDRPSA